MQDSITSSTPTSSSSTSYPRPSTMASATPSGNPGQGLSTGAIIAIGVVCGLFGLVLGLLGAFCWFRARKRRASLHRVSVANPKTPASGHTEEPREQMAELYGADEATVLKARGVKGPNAHRFALNEVDGVSASRPRAELP
jgi:hypothetical protein